MVLTVSFVLSPATNSFCHRRRRIKAHRTRSGRLCLRQLDISNGCQDHTTSPYTSRLRQGILAGCARPSKCWRSPGNSAGRLRAALPLTRPKEPALRRRSRPTLPRPPHPAPTFVTMANAPLRDRMGRACSADLPDGLSGIFFARRLDRLLVICPTGTFWVAAHTT
jgi:hypothetical protein